MVEKLSILRPVDATALNHDRLIDLYIQLGEASADQVICRAMEELAVRLAHSERFYRKGNRAEMRKCTRSMRAIGEQIGMEKLSRIAEDVAICIDDGDEVALAATLSRLIRTGEQSLSEIWNIQGLSG